MSEEQPVVANRQTPFSEAFKAFIGTEWAPDTAESIEPLPAAAYGPARRRAISVQFPGERLVIPAGGLKVRSNDTDYRFRPHSAFAHLTGLGTDREPDAVLVLEPTDDGHEATLYFMPRAPRESEQFYADPRYGEMWVGRRPTLAEMSTLCGIECAPIEELDDRLAKNADQTSIRIVPDADSTLTARVIELRNQRSDADSRTGDRAEPVTPIQSDPIQSDPVDPDEDLVGEQTPTIDLDGELARALSELRLVKDTFEIEQLREACARSADAFAAMVAEFPEAVRRGRGERWVEGIFGLHARHVGNAVGYDTIAAAGEHACTLHWIRNDGDLDPAELILIDAGIELDTLYTADITRTLPVSGTFTDAQREVYLAVLEAQRAGFDAAKPGAKFSDVHAAAVAVIARRLADWGILPVSAEASLDAETGGQHRRWMVHGTSHHLGIDVHDCGQALRANYRDGTLKPGMVITIEPGLYFKSDDLLVPDRFRGIGVRIEDDVLITEDGNENLSAMLPRTPDEVEQWMADLLP